MARILMVFEVPDGQENDFSRRILTMAPLLKEPTPVPRTEYIQGSQASIEAFYRWEGLDSWVRESCEHCGPKEEDA